MIIPNLTSVLKEEGQWKFPLEFNPANFLNEQGQFQKPEAFMPFSAGNGSESDTRVGLASAYFVNHICTCVLYRSSCMSRWGSCSYGALPGLCHSAAPFPVCVARWCWGTWLHPSIWGHPHPQTLQNAHQKQRDSQIMRIMTDLCCNDVLMYFNYSINTLKLLLLNWIEKTVLE